MAPDNHNTSLPLHNPYIVGNPIRDKSMFFGREDDFNYIRQKVTGARKGGLIVLCGARRSGKTSILFQIMNGRLGREFFPVLIDMQAMAVSSDLDFLTKLGQGIIDSIDDPELSLDRDFLDRATGNALSTFQDLAKRAIHKLAGRKLILLFDEYEIIESHIDRNLISSEILSLFQSWIDHEEGIFMVFAGSAQLEERKAAYWDAFLAGALHRRISFLSKSDALRLITEPVQGSVRYEDGAPEKIFDLTAGQPFYTQVVCQTLVDHLNDHGKWTVGDADLEDVIDEIIENPLPQMIFNWNSLSNLEKLALSVIGEKNKETVRPVSATEILSFARTKRIGLGISSNRLNEKLEKLFHQDMLGKEGAEDKYTFKMDLWRFWMARMHSIWQVIDEIKQCEEPGEGLRRHVSWRKRRVAVLASVGATAIALALAWVFWFPEPVPPADLADSTWVTIRTRPPNANVILDDKIIGRSPVHKRRVEAGRTALLIRAEGYEEHETILELQPEVAFDTSIVLIEKAGGVEFVSVPPGAEIRIDAESRGRTPQVITGLSANRTYDIRMTLAGFDDFARQNVPIHADSIHAIRVNFERSRSEVLFVSIPSGAEIYVDDEPWGTTPSSHSLSYGAHKLVLRLAEYQDTVSEFTVPVTGNRIETLLKRLPPGTLIIKVRPYANIYIDDELKKRGGVNYSTDLATGRHTIRVEHPELEGRSEVVRITSRDTVTVQFDLRVRGGER